MDKSIQEEDKSSSQAQSHEETQERQPPQETQQTPVTQTHHIPPNKEDEPSSSETQEVPKIPKSPEIPQMSQTQESPPTHDTQQTPPAQEPLQYQETSASTSTNENPTPHETSLQNNSQPIDIQESPSAQETQQTPLAQEPLQYQQTGANTSTNENPTLHEQNTSQVINIEETPPPQETLRTTITEEIQNAIPQTILSNWKLVAMGVYMFCGTSFSSAPYAIMEGGWLSLFVLPFISVVTYLSALLLGKCFNTTSRKLEDVGRDAHNVYGHILISILIGIFSYATCIGSILMVKDNLQYVFAESQSSIMSWGLLATLILLIVVLVLMCVWRVTENNPWIPGFGVICMVFVVILMLFSGITKVGFKGETVLFKKSTIHMTIGFYVYSFSGHMYMPMFFSSIQKKENYKIIVLLMMVISTFLYGGIAALGYSMYGNDLKAAFTLNLPLKSLLTKLAIFFTVMDLMIRYLLNITIAVTYGEKLLDHYLPGNCTHRVTYQLLIRFVIKFMLVLLTLVPAIFSDFYAQLTTFCGATVGVMVSLIIPVVFFYRIKWPESTKTQKAHAYIIFSIGIGGGLFTLVRSIIKLAEATKTN